MATTPILLTIEQYLQTAYRPDVHFVDGDIEERNVGEYSHNQLQGLLYLLFTLNEHAWGVDAVIEQRMRIGSSLVRVCDLAVLRLDMPHEEVTSFPPLVCIEVLSPSDRLNRASEVLADYLAMGVPNIWVIDPLRRLAYTFDAKGLHLLSSTALTIEGTPITVPLERLFADLDRKIAAHKRL